MSEFKGKRILITGASRGVGKQLALDFGAKGARIAVNYQASSDEAEEVAAQVNNSGGEAFAVQANVASSTDVAAMFSKIEQRFGGLDVLVNNAGLNRDGPMVEMAEADWDVVVDTNLKGPFLCSQQAARLMMREDCEWGRIINISATTSLLGRANAANYISSKAGLNALTRVMAIELGPKIAVNAIALGFLDSPLAREVFSADQIAEVEAGLPSGRIGRFEELSAMVQYLASVAAGFVTGQTIALDGGQSIKAM